MSNPTPASAVVAARVFAIPELLEHILLKASAIDDEDEDEDDEDEDEDVDVETSKPVYFLFRALRVSRNFKATIDGSAKLQRLMFLQSHTSFNDTINRCYSPVLWLFKQLGLKVESTTVSANSETQRVAHVKNVNFCGEDVQNKESQYHALQQRYGNLKERFGAPDASWRSTLVASGNDSDSIIVWFPVRMGFFDEQAKSMFVKCTPFVWEVDAQEKLEAVWCRYVKFMEALKAKEEDIATMGAKREEGREQYKGLISDWADELWRVGDQQ